MQNQECDTDQPLIAQQCHQHQLHAALLGVAAAAAVTHPNTTAVHLRLHSYHPHLKIQLFDMRIMTTTNEQTNQCCCM